MDVDVKLSIIIVSFNAKNILNACLSSIRNADLAFGYEIIVVDNNSADGCQEMVEKEYPNVKLVRNTDNRLFAKANNQGAQMARGQYLLLLNNDTIVEPGNLERLVDFLDTAKENIVCAGPIVLNEDGSLQSSGYALPSIRERIVMVFHLNRILPRYLARILLPTGTPGLYAANHQVGWISGCCMLIKKDVYINVGGLNEELEFYGEEPEFCLRLLKRAYQTWLVADAAIKHLGGQSTTSSAASFLSVEESKLRRYTALQRHTVGIKRSLVMSHIVLVSAYLKAMMSKGRAKEYFALAIRHEKAVIAYMWKQI